MEPAPDEPDTADGSPPRYGTWQERGDWRDPFPPEPAPAQRIDPAAPMDGYSIPVVPGRPVRVWPWRVAVLVASVVAVVALVSALTNADSATSWRTAAAEADAANTAAVSTLEATRSALADTEQLLDASEADVVALTERLDALADEKAQALDEAAAANTGVEVFTDLTRMAAEVSAWLAECIEYQEIWNEVATARAAGAVYEPSEVATFTAEMEATCAEASGRVERLEAALADPYGAER